MSDLRSEMVNKVLNQWENVAMHTSNKPVTGVKTFGERIFEYVKAHPYSSVDEIERGLGVGKEASISSYLKAQLDKGLLDRQEKVRNPYPGHGSRHYFVYYHISDTYNLPKKPRKPREVKKVQYKEPFMTPERIQRDLTVASPNSSKDFNADEFVKTLNVADAKELFLILQGYFE